MDEARRIETHKPRIPDDDWAAIGDVVREAERRLGPKTVEIANASLYAVTTFVH